MLLILAAALPGQVSAADAEGRYAVRGAAIMPCSLYAREEGVRGDVYKIVASWVDGYVTGINQYVDENYDLLSFETTELVLAILARHCNTHPDDPVFGVINSLFEKLKEQGLTHESEKITVQKDDFRVRLYVDTLKRVQSKLNDARFYRGDIDGRFNERTSQAVAAYQSSIGFQPTGFPDQSTLWRLLRGK